MALRSARPEVGAGTFADDDKKGVLGLGAVPVHLLAEMGDESPGRQGHAVIGIEFVPLPIHHVPLVTVM